MDEQAPTAAARAVVFDTDILIWYFRGHERARRFMVRFPYLRRAVSSLTVMELLQGCRNQEETRQVRAFVAENIPRVLHPDESVSRRAIELLARYAMAHGLRVVDALIAATVLETGFSLATANSKHYRAIARLHLITFRP